MNAIQITLIALLLSIAGLWLLIVFEYQFQLPAFLLRTSIARRLLYNGRTAINHASSLSKRHLVVTSAFNFGPRDMEIFLRSLRAYDPEERIDLIVFTNANDPVALDLYEEHRAIVKFVSGDVQSVVKERFSWYYDLLMDVAREHPADHYDMVAFADSRDVAFQSNPFTVTKRLVSARNQTAESKIKEDYVIFSLEGYTNGGMKIGACPYNSGWIRCFGDDVLARLQDEVISCAGVTIGSFRGMFEYNRLMTETIQRTGCNDQGIHNWMLYDLFKREQPPFDALAMGNGQSPVLTVGYIAAPDDLVAAEQTVRLRDGDPNQRAAVVHQFDRYPQLMAHFDRLWRQQQQQQQQ